MPALIRNQAALPGLINIKLGKQKATGYNKVYVHIPQGFSTETNPLRQ